MSHFVEDCPRCHSKKVTFEVISFIKTNDYSNYGTLVYELFCLCRACETTTTFRTHSTGSNIQLDTAFHESGKNLLPFFEEGELALDGYVSTANMAIIDCPDYVPDNIRNAFVEGARCLSIDCFNASVAMFRLALDLATKELIANIDDTRINQKARRNLGLRLPWLFSNDLLPAALQGLSDCVKDYGNDAAHDGVLSKQDAEDIQDFTYILLERLYTEPGRIDELQQRRAERRNAQ